MGLEDMLGGAKDLLKSEQAEGISDNLLEQAADAVDKLTGGKFSDQIDGVKGAVDGMIGNE